MSDRKGVNIPDVVLISALPIMVDQGTTSRAWSDVLTLARTEKLTTYDAVYVELAIRRALPLFTRDQALAAAAKRRGIETKP